MFPFLVRSLSRLSAQSQQCRHVRSLARSTLCGHHLRGPVFQSTNQIGSAVRSLATSARSGKEIPSLLETVIAELSTGKGRDYVFGVVGLAAVALLTERAFSDADHHGAHDVNHHHSESDSDEGPEAAEVLVQEQEGPEVEEVDIVEASSDAESSNAVKEEDAVPETAPETESEAASSSAEAPSKEVEEVASLNEREQEPPKVEAEAGEVVAAVAVGEDLHEEEEEKDCPFCKFMKSGPCGEEFKLWEKCVEEADAEGGKELLVQKCVEATHVLKICMEKNEDYYGVVLEAEKKMDEASEEEAKEDMAETPADKVTEPKVDEAAIVLSDQKAEKGEDGEAPAAVEVEDKVVEVEIAIPVLDEEVVKSVDSDITAPEKSDAAEEKPNVEKLQVAAEEKAEVGEETPESR